ncbi:MAG TPA: GlsB/YeaQ/YmgE family stress response membrane protein [Myxococcaceae bacterium]|nr:GlsB/YeaQ/YmgE family stress response membrane protein [Myxococcaceae bacterium]
MTLETFLLWIAIGAIAGFLASVVVGGGAGLVGDIIIGIVGAFVGGVLFRTFHWHAPFAGIAGTIFIAFVGAVLLLGILRLSRSGRARRI